MIIDADLALVLDLDFDLDLGDSDDPEVTVTSESALGYADLLALFAEVDARERPSQPARDSDGTVTFQWWSEDAWRVLDDLLDDE